MLKLNGITRIVEFAEQTLPPLEEGRPLYRLEWTDSQADFPETQSGVSFHALADEAEKEFRDLCPICDRVEVRQIILIKEFESLVFKWEYVPYGDYGLTFDRDNWYEGIEVSSFQIVIESGNPAILIQAIAEIGNIDFRIHRLDSHGLSRDITNQVR